MRRNASPERRLTKTTAAHASPRIIQMTHEPGSWAFGLKPAEVERVMSRQLAAGLFDPCSTCGS